MGVFDKLGKLAINAIRKPVARPANSTPAPKPGNGGGPYRELQPEAIAFADRLTLARLGIEMIRLPATPEQGFTMGSTEERAKYDDEKPERRVQLASFGLSKTPIANA